MRRIRHDKQNAWHYVQRQSREIVSAVNERSIREIWGGGDRGCFKKSYKRLGYDARKLKRGHTFKN